MAALRFVVQEQKDQISADRRVLERRREEADASSRRRAERSSHYLSSIEHRSRSRTQPRADMHNITQNLEAEFNEAELMPKTKETAIMAAAAYIAVNASNGDEHMRHLRNLRRKWSNPSTGSFGMVWPRTESTKGERGMRHAASREIARRKHLAAPMMDYAGQNALAF
jgi:hypothetical protein